jgi:hypothetical protein
VALPHKSPIFCSFESCIEIGFVLGHGRHSRSAAPSQGMRCTTALPNKAINCRQLSHWTGE